MQGETMSQDESVSVPLVGNRRAGLQNKLKTIDQQHMSPHHPH